MENNFNLAGGRVPFEQFLTAAFNSTVYEERFPRYTWRNFFDRQSYYDDIAWDSPSVIFRYQKFTGASKLLTTKKTKDLVDVDFEVTSDYINLFTLGMSITFTDEEVNECENAYRNVPGRGAQYLVEQKKKAALKTFNNDMDNFFYNGIPNSTKGIFKNPQVVEIKSADLGLGTKPSALKFFIALISKISENSKGVVTPAKMWISRKLYTKLNSYYESSDVNDLAKAKSIVVTTTPEGTPVYLDIRILDRLDEGITSAKPYGDVYVLDSDPASFAFYYKELLTKNFVQQVRGYETYAKYMVSDPFIAVKGALCRCDVPANLV